MISIMITPHITTGTSIISLPYNNGTIVASDSRATDTSSFEHYHCEKSYYTALPEIIVSGAGAACGVEFCVLPFINYLKQQLEAYHINIDDIETPQEFIKLYNAFAINYNKNVINSDYFQVLNASRFIVNVCTAKLNFAFKSRQSGDDLMEAYNSHASNKNLSQSKRYAGDILAIGSGSRYLLGATLQANNKKLLRDCTLEEVKELLITAFSNTTIKDLASAVDNHILIVTLENNKKINMEKITIPEQK